MFALSECTRTVSCIRSYNDSIEPKHVAEFLILITIYIYIYIYIYIFIYCVIDWNKLLCYCNTQRDGYFQRLILVALVDMWCQLET